VIDIRQEVTAVIEATVLVVAALFPIVNPLGSAAIFVNLVGPIAPTTQRLLAQKIGIYSFFLLLCSLLWGVHVLAFFGIQIYAVQIGGGLVSPRPDGLSWVRTPDEQKRRPLRKMKSLKTRSIPSRSQSLSVRALSLLPLPSERICLPSCTKLPCFHSGF
jgi:hypothetical protein